MINYRFFVRGTVERPILINDAKDLQEAKRKAINEWSNLTGGSLDTGEIVQSWVVNVGNGQILIDETSISNFPYQATMRRENKGRRLYYAYLTIPSKYRPLFKKSIVQLKRSLGTTDNRIASKLLRDKEAEMIEEIVNKKLLEKKGG